MAEEQQDKHDDPLEGITEDDAKRLLEPPDKGDKDSEDDEPDGADKLGDAGQKALESIKAQRAAARAERDQLRKELEQSRGELRKHTDAKKTDAERAQGERDELKARAEKAERALLRRDIAERLAPDHATSKQIAAVAKRISGDSDSEMESDAEELFAFIAPAQKASMPGKPKERLRGGGSPSDDDPDEMDPYKLAAKIPRRR